MQRRVGGDAKGGHEQEGRYVRSVRGGLREGQGGGGGGGGFGLLKPQGVGNRGKQPKF